MSKRRSKTPATLAQREALLSEPFTVNFNYTNEEYADAYCPMMRIAARIVGLEWNEHRRAMQKLIANGAAPDLLEDLTLTKRHLENMRALVSRALDRAFVAMELAGYSPDNPPPDSPMH